LEPTDGATVPEKPLVRGQITDPNAKVWVVVHPMEVSDKWVQPPATVGDDGTWAVQAFIGRPGKEDVGKYFEVRAFADPRVPLKEGMILGDWPEARRKSKVLIWTRR